MMCLHFKIPLYKYIRGFEMVNFGFRLEQGLAIFFTSLVIFLYSFSFRGASKI